MPTPLQLLTPDEVADWLNVSTDTVTRWRQTGRGPRAIRVGGLYRYRPDDVTAWLDARPVTAG